MSEKDDHSTDDATLTAYLDGSDGVTDTYRTLDQALPPAGLDARILAAADSLAPRPASGKRPAAGFDASSWQGIVSLAASLVVGVMIGSVFLGNPEQQAESAQVQEKAVAGEQAAVQGLAEPREEARSTAVAETFAIADALAPQPPTQTSDLRQVASADEIVVTGARVQRVAASAAPSSRFGAGSDYRQSLVLWLREIARLQEQVADAGVAELQQQLEEERTLFLQRYPDVGLDLELENLQQLSDGN